MADVGRLAKLVRQLQGALGGRRLASGSGSLSFTASTDSANATITHDLGKQPRIFITSVTAPAFDKIPKFNVATKSTDTADINGRVDTAFTGSVSFDWLAVAE